MTTGPTPEPGGTEVPRPLDNGLAAPRYVPLTDVEPDVGRHLLTALKQARIAAYLDESPDAVTAKRLFVDAEERGDARTIVAAVVRAAGGIPPPAPDDEPRVDPLAGVDTDAAFADLIADWHVDTVTAIRNAERSLTREDADWKARLEKEPAEPTWLDDQHYVPPSPPPLPKLAAPTVMAMSVLAISILLLGLGGQFGLANKLTMLLGVCGVLLGVAILIMRLRDRHDDDDDGAVL